MVEQAAPASEARGRGRCAPRASARLAPALFDSSGLSTSSLVRPVLWRELKVGSRIVSHRFTMGDWTPDKTISMTSDQGGDYELHLWTITEEIKRRQD